MDNIDFEIQRLTSLRMFLKIELNSNYGTGTQSNVQSLFDRRNEVTMELKKLHKLRSRRSKLDKIIKRNEKSMEV